MPKSLLSFRKIYPTNATRPLGVKIVWNHKLDPRVYGETGCQLLRSYQNIKGNNYDPLSIPHALSSQSQKDSKVPPLAESTSWQLIGQRKTLQSSKNAKEEKNSNTGHTNRKKRKVNENNAHQRAHQETITMCGMIWDSNNWSCPYDAIFTILFNFGKRTQANGAQF
ncbi:hypothetical protein K435DRAFT_688002 [Dendrothele bispora CBS 962.96]|uniref:Uncharacterized protein n=1 Tax=Dendrothele bispora (strain CBS 962.96) TaxID=1314807 RepID=A0A4S8L6F6_DENBC|nr:hypothetical protein K435DRAFT_688002 [Dendrothele bispora CBS 962.96]